MPSSTSLMKRLAGEHRDDEFVPLRSIVRHRCPFMVTRVTCCPPSSTGIQRATALNEKSFRSDKMRPRLDTDPIRHAPAIGHARTQYFALQCILK